MKFLGRVWFIYFYFAMGGSLGQYHGVSVRSMSFLTDYVMFVDLFFDWQVVVDVKMAMFTSGL